MLYVLLFLLILFFFLNNIMQKIIYRNLFYNIYPSMEVIEFGEEVKLVFQLENRKKLPITFLEAFLEVPKGMYFKNKKNKITNEMYFSFQTVLMPYQRKVREYTVLFKRRGLYVINNAYLQVGDILGLSTKEISFYINKSVIVLPNKLNFEEVLIPYGSTMGNISVKRFILDDPTMIVGLREYTGFEPQKNIHWPTSLRLNKLMVKNFDYTTDSTVMIVVNVESYKPFYYSIDSKKIEDCISIARDICEKLHDSKIPYGISINSQITSSNNEIIHYGLTEHHRYNVLKLLGMADYNISMPFEDYLEYLMPICSNYSSFVLILPKVFEEYILNIERISKEVNKLIIIAASRDNLELLSSNNIETYVIGGDFN
ncbi:DUF58 domain-containing protein [Caloramator sp. ALD01]|uniref:DUF58 domain-containing protein n=1 Tax=Caloramator sp. ALD01 TaxID=1031288 RepID=UPI0004873EFB|nr:DUF58 domain-containing protein [Caloramator sp. ALD01]